MSRDCEIQGDPKKVVT